MRMENPKSKDKEYEGISTAWDFNFETKIYKKYKI